MTTTNVYFTNGTRTEQMLIEDLIIESLRIYGQEIFYIPRTLVSKDNVLGEDRLSEFKTAFPIEMYFEKPPRGTLRNNVFGTIRSFINSKEEYKV